MDTVQVPPRRGRGRRRASVVRQDILHAAGALLFTDGLREVTFEKVAARAGASKMTLYKWWPSPGALAFEAYFATVEDTLVFPDTGDIEADLITQLLAFTRLLTEQGGGRVMAELIGAAQSDRDLAAAFTQHYVRPRRQLAVDRLFRAQQVGQVRADVDLEAVVDQLWGACYHRLLLPAEPITPAFAVTLVRQLLGGIRNPRADDPAEGSSNSSLLQRAG